MGFKALPLALGTALIAVIIGTVIALVATDGGGTRTYPEDSPEGAVQRFLMALESQDYQKAYGLLTKDLQADCTQLGSFAPYRESGQTEKCDYDDFRRRFSSESKNRGAQAVLLRKDPVGTAGNEVRVMVSFTDFRGSGPFDTGQSSAEATFEMKLEEGLWRLNNLPWPVFSYY